MIQSQRFYLAWLVTGASIIIALWFNHLISRNIEILGFLGYALIGLGFARKLQQLEGKSQKVVTETNAKI